MPASSGSSLSAVAILVRGPIGIRVTSPGYLRTTRRINSAAGSSTGSVFGSGKTAPPSPFSPCTYVAVTRRRSRGALAPGATGMSVRPAISTIRKALGRPSSSGTFPATGVMPSIFNSGERMASSKARASSTPGSVSMITRKGPRSVRSADGLCSDARAASATGEKLAVTLPAAIAAAEVVTNWRRVTRNGGFKSMSFAPVAVVIARGGRVVILMQRSRSLALSTSNCTALKKLHCNASRRDCANCLDIRCILNKCWRAIDHRADCR